jgi:two-component system chemotaxis sensor kinase CheA
MDEEILQEFLTESWENLGQLDSEIVLLEKNPKDAALLASIFRTVHTIKGTCGFIGLTRLGAMAHAAENVLGQLRDGTLEVTPRAISLVLRAVDVIKDLLQGLEATREEPAGDFSALVAELDAFADGKAPPEQPASPPAGPPVAASLVAASSPAPGTQFAASHYETAVAQPSMPTPVPTAGERESSESSEVRRRRLRGRQEVRGRSLDSRECRRT